MSQTPPPGQTVMRARNVSVRIGHADLVRDASLELQAGELVALVGPNGAGKSTLMKCFAGELVPSAGSVELDGRALAAWQPESVARQRAVLPQASSLAFAFTALEIAQFGRHPHRASSNSRRDDEIALAALARADAAHLAQRNYLTLSGGEKARVQLARTLAQIWEPVVDSGAGSNRLTGSTGSADTGGCGRVLLLDEPTAALDLKHQHHTLEVVRALTRTAAPLAALAVLHDLNLAAQYADRIVMMQDGRIVADGTPRAVLTPERISAVFGVDVELLERSDSSVPVLVTRAQSLNNA